MSDRNICRFIPAFPETALSVSCFVRETDEAVMQAGMTLSEYRMILLTQGAGSFLSGGSEYRVRTGVLFFAFPGEHVSFRPEEAPVSYMYIGFSGNRADALVRRFMIRSERRVFSGFEGLIPLWQESLSRAFEDNVDLASESILLYTFSRLDGRNSAGNSLIDRLIALSESRFHDPDFSLSAAAEILSYNPKYLSHLFREKTGSGYAAYLRALRIRYAVLLFDHGIESVKNVALLSGFSNPLYFSTVFREETGLTPTEYRKQAAGKDGPV